MTSFAGNDDDGQNHSGHVELLNAIDFFYFGYGIYEIKIEVQSGTEAPCITQSFWTQSSLKVEHSRLDTSTVLGDCLKYVITDHKAVIRILTAEYQRFGNHGKHNCYNV